MSWMAAHAIALAVTLTVSTFALLNYSFFAWHPIFMILAYALLMSEGILIFSKHSSLFTGLQPGGKINTHGWILAGALLSAWLGFGVIYWTKISYGKPHFTSWHGFMGLITVLYASVQVPAGLLAKYAPSLKIPNVGLLRFFHAMSGTCLSLCGFGTILLGLYSGYVGDRVYFRGAVGVGILLLAMMLMAQFAQLVQNKKYLFSATAAKPDVKS